MKVLRSLLILLAVYAPTSFALYHPKVDIKQWKTSEGVAVYFVNRPQIPMVDLQVVFAAGSAYDGDQWGLASLTGSLIGEGTAKYSATDISDEFASVGAQPTVDVNRDMAVVSLRTLSDPKYFTKALDTFIDVVSHPSLSEDSFKRMKKQTLLGIKQLNASPLKVAVNNFYSLLYGNQPYGHPVLGSQETINKIEQDATRAFYNKYYVGANAKIILVGALTDKQAKDTAEKIAYSLRAGKAADVLQLSTKVSSSALVKNVSFPSQQNTIIVGEVGISRDDPEYFPLVVGNHILGGLPMTSMLFESVRNQKGLAYYVGSQFVPLRFRGPFLILLQTRASMSDKALSVVKKTVTDFVSKGVSPENLKAAKMNLLGSFPLKIASNAGIVANITQIAFYNLPLDYLNTYPSKVDAVNAQDINKAFPKVVQYKNLKRVIVGPSEVGKVEK